MKWLLCTCCLFASFIISLTGVITEYKYLQQDGNVEDLYLLGCQLAAHGNSSSCAVRIDTRMTDSVKVDNLDWCALLSLEWCYKKDMESGYTYVGKAAVLHSQPFTFVHFSGDSPSWQLTETIPLLINQGSRIIIKITPPTDWKKIYVNLNDEAENLVFDYNLSPLSPSSLAAGVSSTLTIYFARYEVRLYVDVSLYATDSYVELPNNIRYLQIVFYEYQGDVQQVSYRVLA